MRFIVNGPSFLKQLQSISGVVGANNTLPILDNFYFHLRDNVLEVRASDLETTILLNIELENATIDGVDTVAVPGKMLLDILKTFPDVPLNFSVNPENWSIEILSGEGKYKLAGQSAETFPQIPDFDDLKSVNLTVSLLTNAISKTIFATSNDELRPNMLGVFCELTPENIAFVATDAHKLVRYRRYDVKVEETQSFILPKKPLNLIKNILGSRKEDSDVIMEYNATNVFFKFDNYVISCRLIDAKYPNYEAAIPSENPNKLILDRQNFLNVVRRISIFANQSTHQVRLNMSAGDLLINAEDLEFSNEARERVSCNYEGEPMEIGFNSKFLIEMLNNVDTEEITIEMSQPNRAGIIYPIETVEDNPEDLLMLVMPVMFNQ